MPSFFLAFLAVVLASFGGRDQLLVAQMAGALGRHVGLLVIGCISAIVTALLMAAAGDAMADFLPSAGKTMLVAIALLLAVAELLWPGRKRKNREPTRSLFAITLVLFSRQIGDAGRFLTFALAAALGAPVMAGIGGALGGVLAICIGWFAGEELAGKLPLYPLRIALAVIIFVVAMIIGLTARGILN